MKWLLILMLCICGQIVAQVPVILKSKEAIEFDVYPYEVKYHVSENDSIKIDGFVESDLALKHIDKLLYEATLELNTWYLLLYVDLKGHKKHLFFKTEEWSLTTPLVLTADFLNPNTYYYVQYDPIKQIYTGEYLNVPPEE